MFPAALECLLALPDAARVLDVGGWAAPVNRADWVIDAMPYETRGALLPGGFGPPPERFSADTWVIADLCGSAPWPFEDDFFDFAICTFTLEDLRDPIRVCEEMSRVARAGYIEVPSLLDELVWMNPEAGGGRWLGHSHHRWLCSLEDGVLTFLPKHHSVHAHREVRVSARWGLSDEDRVLAHFWQGSLPARERMAIDDYPFAELERAVRDRFGPMPAPWRALAFAHRARAYARWRLASVRNRRTPAGRRDGSDDE
ncbi:MAG TPA: methyltransferase domain-containing protein [Solirubrobacteraceae bacterium]|nr:methyltransferase domain-containing protein [Solirubrobacteraceae bacterium]